MLSARSLSAGVIRLVLVLGGTVVAASQASAQTLALQGDHFAVNGQGKFLLFISYYHGIHRPLQQLRDDLDLFVAKGFHGIRVLPDWGDLKLMTPTGSYTPGLLAKLVTLVDEAGTRGLIVDITFARELVSATMVHEDYKDGPAPANNEGIKGVGFALRTRRNVLFDLWNEWLHDNCQDPPDPPTTCAQQLLDIKTAVKSVTVDPLRIVVASTGAGVENVAFVKKLWV